MSKVLVTEEYLEDIADAIREKTGGSATYTPAQMGNAIRNIPSGGEIMVASVTADGVKTYAALLSDLAALIPSGVHPRRLTIGGWVAYLGYYDAVNVEHRYVSVFGSDNRKTFARSLIVKENATTNVYFEYEFGASATDLSNTVPASGLVISLYEV